MKLDLQKDAVKIRYSDDNRFLVAVMPNGDMIPLVTNLTVNSNADEITTATITVIVDTTEFVKHK